MQTLQLKASDIATGPLFIKDDDTDMERDGFIQYNVRDGIKLFANNEEISGAQLTPEGDASGWWLITGEPCWLELLDNVKVEVYS